MGENGFLAIIVLIGILACTSKVIADTGKSPTELLEEYEKDFPRETDTKEKCLFQTLRELKRLNLRYHQTEDSREKFEIKKEIAHILVRNKRNYKALSEGGWISKMSVCEGWTFGAERGNGWVKIHLTHISDVEGTNFSIPFK